MTRRKKNKTKDLSHQAAVSSRTDDRRHFVIVCAFCALGFLLYANTMLSSFHFDDWLVIVNNPAIRHLWDIPLLFDAFNTRVITGWTFALNYALSRLDVFEYHFLNIWLHVCNSVLVYVFILQCQGLDRSRHTPTGRRMLVAATAAGIFLLHPIQTQAVDYVWQRTTLLAAFFFLATLVLYIHGRTTTQRRYERAALVTCLAAMLSKEVAFTLPLAVGMIDWLLFKTVETERRPRRLLAFGLMLLVIPLLLQRSSDLTIGLMRAHDLTSGVAPQVMAPSDYRLTQVNVAVTYLRLFLWPSGQSIDHDYPSVIQTGWGWWFLCLMILTSFFYAGCLLVRRRPLAALGIFWFFLTLCVESFVVSADFLVEHRLYLPMVGLSLVGALIFERFIFGNRKVTIAVLIALGLLLSVLTFNRNTVWRNDVGLWSDAIQKAPLKARGYNNRGVEYKKMGFFDLALSDFTRAVELRPDYAPAYYNRGTIYKQRKAFGLAEADFARVIELEPQNFQGFDARGYIFRRQGRYQEALRDFTTSIALNSRNPEVFNNRASIYQKQGRQDLAIADYTRAIEADPTYIYAYNNRGNVYLEEGKEDLAIADYTRAISLNSDFGEAYVNRAVAYWRLKRLKESRLDARRARELGVPVKMEFLQQLETLQD